MAHRNTIARAGALPKRSAEGGERRRSNPSWPAEKGKPGGIRRGARALWKTVGSKQRAVYKMVKQVKLFYNELQAEMKKVTWPTREELMESTGVVMISVSALAVFVGVVDFVLSRVVSIFLR